MNRFDELINKYCPDGVRYTPIGQCVRKVGTIKWKETNGQYQYIDLASVDRDTHQISETQTINADNAPSRAQQIVHTNDVLLGATRPMLKRYCYIEDKFDNQICSTGFCVLRANDDVVLPRWIYHQISSTAFFAYVEKVQKGASYPAIADADVKAFRIPVPPIPVQREIVRILDNFTELTAELTAELTVELTARKKQYEFYRNELLSFTAKSEMVELGDVCHFVRGPFGGALKKEIFQPNGYAVYEQQNAIYQNLRFRYYIDEEKFNELRRFAVQPGDVIVSCSGTIGKTFVIPENAPEGIINQALLKLTPNSEKINVFYLQFFFENTISKIMNKVARGGAIKNVPSVSELKAIKLYLPPVEIQRRIVNVLDNFDAICSDLNIGLPAEIEARKKQYEYYRDMLLTFAAADDIILTDRQTDRQTKPN